MLNSSMYMRFEIIGDIENGRLISVVSSVLLWNLNFVIVYDVYMLNMRFSGIVIMVMVSVSLIVDYVLGLVSDLK